MQSPDQAAGVAVPAGGRPRGGEAPNLFRQQRNLLLMRPIIELEISKNVIARSDPGLLDGIDTHYLALALFDFVIECTAMDLGAQRIDILDYLAALAGLMKPSLDPDGRQRVAEIVLDHLSNKRGGHGAFELQYFDAGRNAMADRQFRLLRFEQVIDGSFRYKLSEEGFLVFMAMLDVDPQLAQQMTELMIKHLIERGRFKHASDMAARARWQSIQLHQTITSWLFKIGRAPDSVNWTREVIPYLDESRDHIKERYVQESAILTAVEEHLDGTSDPDIRADLISLKDVVEDCRCRHGDLAEKVIRAPEEFRELQVYAFRARDVSNLPSLEQDVLLPLLTAPLVDIAPRVDDMVAALLQPSCPHLYDMSLLFEMCLAERAADAQFEEDEEPEFVEPMVWPDLFTRDMEQEIADFIAGILAKPGPHDMKSIYAAAEAAGMDDVRLRCLTFALYRYFAPAHNPLKIPVEARGRFAHRIFEGSGLVFGG